MKYLSLVIILLALGACDKEEQLVPSDSAGDFVNIETALNQGTKMYNDRIQSYYDRFGAVLSYEFPAGVLHYNGNTAYNYDTRYYTVAQEEKVGTILDLFDTFMGYFPDTLLNYLIPRNILVVDSLSTEDNRKKLLWTDTDGLAKIILGGAGLTLQELKDAGAVGSGARGVFRDKLCSPLVKKLFTQKILEISLAFSDLVFWQEDMSEVTFSTYKKYGFISNPNNTIKATKEDLVEWDFNMYLQNLFTRGKEGFEDYYLKASFDSTGKIREKYEMMLRVFKEEYGIDLEKLVSNEALLFEGESL